MSRYPSAYGHTPSYKSVGSLPSYPSALGSRNLDLEMTSGLSGRSTLGSGLDREISSLTSSLKTDPLMKTSSALASSGHSGSSSAYKSEQYSSVDGRPAKHESSYDSTYRSRAVGDSGIPHSSYSHSLGSYSSDRPYKNTSSHFSYNI